MTSDTGTFIREAAERVEAAWTELLAPGSRFEVAVREVGGVPMRTYLHGPENLREVWLDTRRFGGRDYLVFGDERVSYEQAHRVTASVGRWLGRQGVRAGDRVGIAMRNYPEWLLIYWACVSMGVAVVGLNAWWTSEELTDALHECRPSAIFCDGERLDRLAQWRGDPANDVRVVAVRTPPIAGVSAWSEVIAGDGGGSDAIIGEVAIDPDADACIFFTSGTTGRSKGARLTHRSCANNLMNLRFGLEVGEMARRGGEPVAPAATPVVLLTTPLFHVTANNTVAHPASTLGGMLVLMYKWDAEAALRAIERERVTLVVGIPLMLREILEHPEAERHDLSSLTGLSGGGGPIPPNFVRSLAARPGAPAMGTGYGMTETSGTVAFSTGPSLAFRPESCGRIVPTFEAKVVDDDGATLPPNTPGELCLRGPGVIPGYLGQPLDHAGPPEERWMRTGDVAVLDEGDYLFIVDRKKDMILRGGENVYCAEVEAALFAHPGVAEACAFAVADDRMGEEVGAVVHRKAGAEVTSDELRNHVGQLLARYKVPRFLWLADAPLPRNASGKFLRRRIKEGLLAAELAGADGLRNGGES